jgi:two-component system chemotaxis response regulator CheY
MPYSVLIVDDSAFSRRMLRKIFPEQWQVDITEASNGKEALVALDAKQFDIMFLDLTMPTIDGFGVLEELKKRSYFSCKIFVVSADVQPKAKQLCMDLGALAFLRKPLDAETLMTTLKQHGLL